MSANGRAEGIALLLRQYPEAGLEAIAGFRTTDRWVSEGEGVEQRWLRYPLFDGRKMLDGECPHTPSDCDREPLGYVVTVDPFGEPTRWEAWVDDDRIGTYCMVALAQRAIDTALQSAGWSCP